MEPDVWLERWEKGQIGFHQREIHPALPAHWASLRVPARGAVFVPLCGKSHDMLWLHAQGHPILGVELSPIAVRDFFAENRSKPSVSQRGKLERHEADGVALLCGDFFDLTPAHLEGVAAAYDCASLIALPPDMRERYVEHMAEVVPENAAILLIALSYPDNEMEGPPFSVSETEVHRLYGGKFNVKLLSSSDVLAENPHITSRGVTRLMEHVYRITRRRAA